MNKKQILKQLGKISGLVVKAGNIVSAIDEMQDDRIVILVADCAVLTALGEAVIKLADLQEGLTPNERLN